MRNSQEYKLDRNVDQNHKDHEFDFTKAEESADNTGWKVTENKVK